ncbi:MAG: carbohydrate ABC transporter permease [Lachnospiraceae bacterium]|jgi:putative aldouronate transport system permease protein|nr:carbohydrate ABC transporter permease [Lachnospiraceae bacterium]
MSKRRYPCSASELLFRILGYVLLFSFGMLCVTPFYLIGISSLASEPSLIRNGFRMIPEEFSLDAYRLVFTNPARIGRAYLNTIFVTLAGTVLSLFLTTLTGYVLSRRDFKWRNGFSFFFFFTTLFSGGLIPWYILCTQALHFKNTYYALILPMAFPIWNMIIAKNFMRGVPYEISESAKMDGAGELTIYFKLYLPISKPLLATLGLFAALAYWNDWYNSMLFNTKEEMQSLQYFLQDMLSTIQALKQLIAEGNLEVAQKANLPTTSMRMAMTCVVTGPIIFLYPVVQRYFIKGLTIGAVKG